MLVKIFKVDRASSNETWQMITGDLQKRGFVIHREAEPADVSIALSGKLENPLALSGKRVLAYAPGEWQPQYYGWRFFARILKHYYHDFIDLSGTSAKEAVDKIERYVHAQKQQIGHP